MPKRERIERDGCRFVLVPEADYERMIDALDDYTAICEYHDAKAKNEELIPDEFVGRLLDGENRIRVWREYRGMTQQALAQAAGLGEPYLSQLEDGREEPSPATLEALAAALRLDLYDLLVPTPVELDDLVPAPTE
ncbi:MAG TPA: helix-turn-helix transcriptional regulator [Stellaceae bacterium]|nr:helix-turn-helix transcriptional regulator [Stellaceae bacterium]